MDRSQHVSGNQTSGTLVNLAFGSGCATAIIALVVFAIIDANDGIESGESWMGWLFMYLPVLVVIGSVIGSGWWSITRGEGFSRYGSTYRLTSKRRKLLPPDKRAKLDDNFHHYHRIREDEVGIPNWKFDASRLKYFCVVMLPKFIGHEDMKEDRLEVLFEAPIFNMIFIASDALNREIGKPDSPVIAGEDMRELWSAYYQCLQELQKQHLREDIEHCRETAERVMNTIELGKEEMFY